MNDLVPYPTATELEQTWKLAAKLARTEFVAKPMRNSPEAVLACILTGRELGIGPMQSLRDVYLVNGRPSLSATLMVARVRAGGHRFRTLENSDHQATVQVHRNGEPAPEPPVTFTIEDAKRAKLISKDVWQQYPARMLWARAASACCRRDCPEVLGGAGYTPEELEDVGTTEATWGDVEVEVEVEESAAGVVTTPPTPAVVPSGMHTNQQGIPTGHYVPILSDIKLIRSVRDAKQLIQMSAPQFQALVPKAILAVFNADPHAWWDNTTAVDAWRQVLEYAVELHEQQQHETSAGGAQTPPGPAAGTQSGRGRAEQTPREGRQDSATTPRPDNPESEDGS